MNQIRFLVFCLFIIGINNIYAQNNKLRVIIGSTEFSATLNDNETVNAFIDTLPLDINMTEMGGYEKYFYLSQSLPGTASNVNTTYEGDLMIWSSNCLVLFYTIRNTSYNYIRLGRIDDTTGFKQALGSGNVCVRFEMELPNSIENSKNITEKHKIIKIDDYVEVSGDVRRLSLYSLSGVYEKKSEENTISMEDLNVGVYMLKIETKNSGIITKKIVKN